MDDNTIPAINWKEIRTFMAMEHFTVEIIQSKNSAAAGVCSFVRNIVMVRYFILRCFVRPRVLENRWQCEHTMRFDLDITPIYILLCDAMIGHC